MSGRDEETGGLWLAPVRPNEKMLRRMAFQFHDLGLDRDDLLARLEGVWAAARYASPDGGRVVKP